MHVIRLTQGDGVKMSARHSRDFFAQRRVPDSCLCQTKAALLSSPRLVIRVHRTHNQASHQPERDIFRTHQHDHSSGNLIVAHDHRTSPAPDPLSTNAVLHLRGAPNVHMRFGITNDGREKQWFTLIHPHAGKGMQILHRRIQPRPQQRH